jgi:uncharacterized membrane protein YdbT with pleckstrin-like domain
VAISSKLLNEGEHVVVSTRTHPKVLILPLLIFLVLVALGVFLSTVGDGGAAHVMHIVVWIIIALAVLWLTVRPVITWATTTYTFTNRRFHKRSGLVAKEGRTIPLNRISGVDFEMGVIDRIFGCGTLVVSDASTDGRVELDDIPKVEQVQLKVAEELHRLAEPRHDDGS